CRSAARARARERPALTRGHPGPASGAPLSPQVAPRPSDWWPGTMSESLVPQRAQTLRRRSGLDRRPGFRGIAAFGVDRLAARDLAAELRALLPDRADRTPRDPGGRGPRALDRGHGAGLIGHTVPVEVHGAEDLGGPRCLPLELPTDPRHACCGVLECEHGAARLSGLAFLVLDLLERWGEALGGVGEGEVRRLDDVTAEREAPQTADHRADAEGQGLAEGSRAELGPRPDRLAREHREHGRERRVRELLGQHLAPALGERLRESSEERRGGEEW